MRLHDMLEYHAREHSGYEMAVMGDHRLTYRDANKEVNRIANALIASGLQIGDRAAYLSKNSIDQLLFYFGASKAGAVPVPLNYRLVGAEWTYIINDAKAKALFARGEFVDAADKIRDKLDTVEHCYAIDANAPPGWQDYRAWVASGADESPTLDVTERDDLYQMYTSGTTGRPKGAVLTHRAVMENILQIEGIFEHPLSPKQRGLVVAPMYHAAAALQSFVLVSRGATIVLHEEFDPHAVVKELSEGEIFQATLVPAMIQACLVMVPDVAERSYDDLKVMIYGASPIAEETLRRAMDVFKCGFYQGYGMTETTACLTFLRPPDHEYALKHHPELLLSCGRPVMGTEVRVVDENDNEVPVGEIGEIIGRGAQLMKGYWNMPEATEKSLKGGWMHTGDAGRMDEHGYVYIQDRVKDMIVSGAENIYPREVENAIFEHPAIADAAVIGIPSDQWGETVKACVVLKDGEEVTEEDLIAFCRERLGGYKVPRSVDFLKELPRNASGKVLKKDLRAPYWEGQKRQVG